ncbi:MAG: hypothetical protein ACR2QO_21095 [Acidimicrobiales bacterium]
MGDKVGDRALDARSPLVPLLVSFLIAAVVMTTAPQPVSADRTTDVSIDDGSADNPDNVPLVGGDGADEGSIDGGRAVAAGRVTNTAGEAVDGVIVDLFGANDRGGQPRGYLQSIGTSSDGEFAIDLPQAGCYRLEFHPLPGSSSSQSRRSREFCTTGDTIERRFDAVLEGAATGRIVGRVAYETGTAARAAVIELFGTAGDGSRSALIETTVTRSDGSFRLTVGPGCYVVVVVPPGAERLLGSGRQGRHDVCLAEPESETLRVTLVGDAPPDTSLSAVELELLRLTNLLRSDPGGPLRRQKPLPACVDDAFYEIAIVASSGHPAAVPPLAMSELTSNGLARSWAIEMARSDRFRHRPSATQQQLYASFDIEVTAWGENIAWFDGYDAAQTARIHFEGWRESETGHYCTMITPRFTNVGIGEYRERSESWAVQNFYAVAPDRE